MAAAMAAAAAELAARVVVEVLLRGRNYDRAFDWNACARAASWAAGEMAGADVRTSKN